MLRDDFQAAILREEFLEHAEVHGNMYGTSHWAAASLAASGKVPVLDIDVQGSKQVLFHVVLEIWVTDLRTLSIARIRSPGCTGITNCPDFVCFSLPHSLLCCHRKGHNEDRRSVFGVQINLLGSV